MALVLRLGSRGRSKGNPPSSSSSHIVFFSSSNSNSNSPFSLLFRDISENLKQPPPSQRASTDLIRENLNKFRARTTAPPPPPQKQISFQQLYNENIHGNPTPPKISSSSFNINSIRESLKNIRSADTTQTSSRPKDGWRYASPSPSPSPSSSSSTAFLRTYSVEDLGEKLRSLRPQAEGKDWFSVRELSERLGRLRKMEEESANSISSQDDVLSTVRGTLMKLDKDQTDSANKASRQGLSILSHLSGTPIFSLDPPKPLLLQKYFHPDNMSSADKMKIELAKVRDEFKMSESDCGSSRVQIALLTTKIKHLSAVLHKKDVHSRKGLVAMVQRRKKLLKYLRRTDWDSYCFVISKLGLRDNPDHVYKARTGMAA